MTELSVFIVNSKIWHAQLTVQMLKARVSFPVYQETYNEPVWNILEGGKDDMFIYDRCGRLIEFIPFPLSILTKDRVKNAIWEAYYDDPCGSCTTQKPMTEAPTTHLIKEVILTTEANTSFNLTSKCPFDLEQCETILSDSYLAYCCAQMFGNPEMIEESTQCINMTEKSCDELQMAEDCCKEVKEEECSRHNESTCFELLENELQTTECCDQLQTDENVTLVQVQTAENVSQCENITSTTCKEHKKNKLCCKQPVPNNMTEEQPYQSYNYTCNDYDETKCASLDEERNLIRCCVNSKTDKDTVEDLNYDAECHNVTKLPCESVQFTLDCCHQVQNGSKMYDSHIEGNGMLGTHHNSHEHLDHQSHGHQSHENHGHQNHEDYGHQGHKNHDHHHKQQSKQPKHQHTNPHKDHKHDEKHPKIYGQGLQNVQQPLNVHKHRHHHGEINNSILINLNIELGQNTTEQQNNFENVSDYCITFSLEKCKEMQISLKRVLRCCSKTASIHLRCRLIVPQCDRIKKTNKCCRQIFEKQNEITNQEQTEKNYFVNSTDTHTENPKSNIREEGKSRLNK